MGFRSGFYFGSAVYFEYVFVFFFAGGLVFVIWKDGRRRVAIYGFDDCKHAMSKFESFQKLSERIQTANLPGKPMEYENWMFGDKDGVSRDHALDFAKEQVRNRKRNLEIQADKDRT